jgi:transcriptional regulator with XRE-family HTH domain
MTGMDAEKSGERPTGFSLAVADELRGLIAKRRISGVRLAQMAEMSQPYLSRRLNGAVPFDLDDLDRIAHALDIDVLKLLTAAREVSAGLNSSSVSPDVRPAQHVVRVVPERRPITSRTDPARPASAVPANRRRPVSIRPPARPLAV